MALRWTPKRFITRRRWRIAITSSVCAAICISSFFIGTYKSVALTVNGKTTHVNTLALTVDGLLSQENVKVKTHDFVKSTSGERLTDNAHVQVRSAYEVTVMIDGQPVGFWTYAKSADELLRLFKQNEKNAVKVTVSISNIYNKLTGGLIINAQGTVKVIADGHTSDAVDGKVPAAAILDAQGISVGQHDRVSVEQDGTDTILRVVRVTYSDSTREVEIPFTTRTVKDDSLEEGKQEVVQQGINGKKTQNLHNTLADGQVESSEVTSEAVTQEPQEEIIHVGTKKKEEPKAESNTQNNQQNSDQSSSADQNKTNQNKADQDKTKQEEAARQAAAAAAAQEAARKAAEAEAQRKAQEQAAQQQAQQQAQSGLWHPTPAQAQAYAQAAAAQYGWTGDNWNALVWLWNRESGWRWNAENRSSGAYGIPQSLPGNKMATYGANWRDDAAIQINWGLNYIAKRYGSPLGAQQHSYKTGWY